MKQRVVVSHRSSGIRNIFKSRTGWCYHLLTCQGRSTPYVGDGRPLTFNDGILGPWGPINPYGLGLMSLSPKYMEIMGVDRPDRTYQNKIWRTMVQNPQQNETFFLVRDRDTPRSPRVLSKHVLQLGCHSLFYYLYSWICWADTYNIYIPGTPMTSILEGTQPPQNKAFSNKNKGPHLGEPGIYNLNMFQSPQGSKDHLKKIHLEQVLPIHENKFLYVPWSKVAILGMVIQPLMTESL